MSSCSAGSPMAAYRTLTELSTVAARPSATLRPGNRALRTEHQVALVQFIEHVALCDRVERSMAVSEP